MRTKSNSQNGASHDMLGFGAVRVKWDLSVIKRHSVLQKRLFGNGLWPEGRILLLEWGREKVHWEVCYRESGAEYDWTLQSRSGQLCSLHDILPPPPPPPFFYILSSSSSLCFLSWPRRLQCGSPGWRPLAKRMEAMQQQRHSEESTGRIAFPKCTELPVWNQSAIEPAAFKTRTNTHLNL